MPVATRRTPPTDRVTPWPVTARALVALVVLLALAAADLASTPTPDASAQAPTEGYRLVDTWAAQRPETTLPDFRQPTGLDVADDDTIFVADRAESMLYRISADTVVQGSWPTNGSVGRPRDVAVLGDRVYVLGDRGGEIRSLDGAALRTWTTEDGLGIAAGPDRRLYVSRLELVDRVPSAVIDVLDVDGGRLETWRAQLPIRSAFGLDVGPDGKVYLAADGVVYIFEAGMLQGGLRLPSALQGPHVLDVAVDVQGRVFAVHENRVVAWDTNTDTYLGERDLAGAAWLAAGPGPGLVVSTINGGGFTGLSYVPDRSQIVQVTEPILRWGDVAETLGQLVEPRRLATSPGGDLYIADRLERVQRWSPTGRPLEQWQRNAVVDVVGGSNQPCSLHGRMIGCLGPVDTVRWEAVPSPDGWLTASEGNASRLAAVDLAEQRVWMLDRQGQPVGDFALAGPGGYTAVTDVAVGQDRIHLANRSDVRVETLAFDGQVLGSLPLQSAAARITAADGMLYVLDRDGWIWKYASDGILRAVWRPLPDAVPTDIAAGPGGRVYVAVPKALSGADEDQILVFEPGGPPGSVPPPPPEDRCELTVDKRAQPDSVYIGERVTVELQARGSCPPSEGQLDVALILDKSGSMLGAPLVAAQTSAITFLNELEPGSAQVSVVAFSDTASVLQPLTSDLREAVRAVASLTAGGQTRYVPALDLALGQLTGPASRAGVPRVVIFMTDGKPTDETFVPDAVRRMKNAGVTVYTIGLGRLDDETRALLAGMASRTDHFFEAPTEGELAAIYAEIARRITSSLIMRTATVTDELPADMSLVPGSPDPPAEIQGQSRTLVWRLTDVPATGQTLRYEVRPQRSGRRPTNVRAMVDYVDAIGETGRLTFPIPEVEVRLRKEAYLPLVFRNICRPQRADVALVFDISSSMTAPAGPGGAATKLSAALQAGRIFLDAMTLPGDQAAIVTFDENASIVQPLTGSRGALEAALSRIEAGAGTRIDRGLDAATIELLGGRRIATNNPVIVLLSDGRPTPGSEGKAQAEASVARAFGIPIFAIGLGADADVVLLLQIANKDSQVFFAPDASALESIYSRIAGTILCE